MSFFGKQVDRASPIAPSPITGDGAYGIGDVIRLLKTIPIDHHPQLVVQVMKTTLESVGVDSSLVIEDALARENGIREALGMLEEQILVLRQEIEARQNQIAEMHVALREIADARNLLANAEAPSGALPSIDLNLPHFESSEPEAIDPTSLEEERAERKPRSLPPPLPPPRWKTPSGQPQETTQER
jgi:hypothetical protein